MDKNSEERVAENNVEKYSEAILMVVTKIYEPFSEEEKNDPEFLGENFNQAAIKRKVHRYFGAKGFSSNQYWFEAFDRLLNEEMLKEIVTSGHRKTLIPSEKGLEEGRKLLNEKGLPLEEERGLDGLKVVEIKGTSTGETGDIIQDVGEFLSVARSLGVKQIISWKGPSNEFEARFYYEGKLFHHRIQGNFENLEDYVEAGMVGASSIEELEIWRKFKAGEKDWPSYESLQAFLKGVTVNSGDRYQELWEPLMGYRSNLDKNPDILPEFEPFCKTAKDWRFCMLAKAHGWENYEDFLNFIESKKTIDLDEEEAGDLLLFYLGSLTFQQAKDDWLQGWRRFKEIAIFWDLIRVVKGSSGKYAQNRGHRDFGVRQEFKEILLQYARFKLPPYDPDCLSPQEWATWIIANENGWKSYMSLIESATRKLSPEFKLQKEQKENLLLLLAKMNPENSKKAKLKTDTEGKLFLITEDQGMMPL